MKSQLPVLVVLLTAGCAPLSQAPLVYSSVYSFGVNVSATNPETPGIELDVGFKSKDLAIVPVAVAKLPKKLSKEDSGNIQIIRATSGIGDPAIIEQTKAQVADANKAVREKREALRLARNELAETQARTAGNVAKMQELGKQITEERTKLAVPEALADGELQYHFEGEIPESLGALSQQKEDIGNLVERGKQEESALSAKVAGLESEEKTAEGVLTGAKQLLQQVESKNDAYSVFGNFGSDTAAGAKADGKADLDLAIGKIFATGVAAQNISTKIGESTRALSVAKCLEALNAATNGNATAAAVESCGR